MPSVPLGKSGVAALPVASASRIIPGPVRRPFRGRTWFMGLATGVGMLSLALLLCWWMADDDAGEVRALPDAERLPLYHRAVANLRNVCDPGAPRSLRDFCRREAELVLRFRECDSEPACQELARRHLSQPRR